MTNSQFRLGNFLVLLSAFLSFSSIPAQGENPPPSAPGPIPHLPWLHEGLVLNGTWATFVYPGHSMDFCEDEHGKIHLADGTNLTASPRKGSSASGVTAATITCIDGNKVCLISNSFADMRLLGCKDPVPQHMPLTFVFDAAQCDLWIDPVRLADMHNHLLSHAIVTPIQWTAGDHVVDCIRVTTVQANFYSDHVYDRKTGLCLHYCEISKGASPTLKYHLRGEPPQGDTLIATGDFLAARDAAPPWVGEPMPAWTKQFKALHYRGSTGVVGAALAVPQMPIGIDVTNPQSANGWLGVALTNYLIARGQPVFPTKSIFVCGRGQFDGFFAGPAGLAKLHAGQVLDDDPVTHMQTVVSAIDDHSVTITSANAGGKVFHTFDRNSGKLLAWATFDSMTHTQTTSRLQGEE